MAAVKRIVTQKGYQAEILDSGELVYYNRWENPEAAWGDRQEEGFLQCWYTFGSAHRAGAKICVEKEKMELYELAHEIVLSLRFE